MEPGGNHGAQTSPGATRDGDLSFSDAGSFVQLVMVHTGYQNAIGQLQSASCWAGGQWEGAAVSRGANVVVVL